MVIPGRAAQATRSAAKAASSDPLIYDNVDLEPQGWLYVVKVELQDLQAYTFTTALPSSPSTVDLSALEPVSVSIGGAPLIPVQLRRGTTCPLVAARRPGRWSWAAPSPLKLIFFVSAIPFFDFSKYAMNIGVDASGAAVELPDGHGPFLPLGTHGILAALPFAVWLFLAIEELPLAAEESADPKRDMPKGIMLGMFTLIGLGFLVLLINPAIPITREVTDAAGTATVVHGAFALGTSGEPILDGFRAIFGSSAAKILSLIAVAGLIASFHTIIFAYGRRSSRCRGRATYRTSCRSPTARTRPRTSR